jgi:hypothetical protein
MAFAIIRVAGLPRRTNERLINAFAGGHVTLIDRTEIVVITVDSGTCDERHNPAFFVTINRLNLVK